MVSEGSSGKIELARKNAGSGRSSSATPPSTRRGRSADSASAALKLEANANDLAIVNVAAWIRGDKQGQCTEARIYVGGGVGETFEVYNQVNRPVSIIGLAETIQDVGSEYGSPASAHTLGSPFLRRIDELLPHAHVA